MVKKLYIPDRGDVIWVNFQSSAGHEQKGKRPAIVVSPKVYNKRSELALICPITSTEKGYPFEISLDSKKIKGVILTDQMRTVDWKQRKTRFMFKVKPSLMLKLQDKIKLLIL